MEVFYILYIFWCLILIVDFGKLVSWLVWLVRLVITLSNMTNFMTVIIKSFQSVQSHELIIYNLFFHYFSCQRKLDYVRRKS